MPGQQRRGAGGYSCGASFLYLWASEPQGSNALSVRKAWTNGRGDLRIASANTVARAWGSEARKYETVKAW